MTSVTPRNTARNMGKKENMNNNKKQCTVKEAMKRNGIMKNNEKQ